MNKKKKVYKAPMLEVLEVKVERGFVASAQNILNGGSIHGSGASGYGEDARQKEYFGSWSDINSFSKKY